MDIQCVPTAGEAHWCDAFVAHKSDFTELEKKVRQRFNTAQPQNRSDKRSHNYQKQHAKYFENDIVY